MKMDDSRRDPVVYGDSDRISWPTANECWEDSSSITGLNIEHASELSHLVEDQEIAAQAVAFVVNSSRKGIVPLCADVAHIMRSKRSLEHKLARLRGENDALRSSLSASSCTSPTPASLTSYEQRSSTQADRVSPCLCSRCSSQCSSLVSNSPKLLHHQRSPRLQPRSSAFSVPASLPTKADQQTQAADSTESPPCSNGLAPTSPPAKLRGHQRKNSLPEMVSEPHSNVPKVSPRVKTVHMEIQCCLDTSTATGSPTLEQQFKETLSLNARLTEELAAAKKEITALQAKVKENKMCQLARQYNTEYHVENETTCVRCHRRSSSSSTGGIERTASLPDASSSECTSHLPVSSSTGTINSGARLKTPSPVTIGGYLVGCKCSNCEKLAMETESHKLKKSASGSVLQVELDDHIVLRGEKTGYVKYVGHLDNMGQQPSMVFVGVQLDAPVGRHNGALNGKRYFSCDKDCGLVVPLSDVVCVISKQPQSCPSTDPPNSSSSKPSSSSRTHPRIYRSMSERVERECMRKRLPHNLKTERRYINTEPQNLKLPKDEHLQSGHLV